MWQSWRSVTFRAAGYGGVFMYIVRIEDSDKWTYRDLLLLADEQINMIERYLYRGEMFALWDGGDARSVCVVTRERDGACELKNLATRPDCQRRGYGGYLIRFLSYYCRGAGTVLYVGTGDNPETLAFYENRGFVRSHVVKDFFTDHYDHPIYENGVRLADMIYLKKTL